MMLKSSLCDHGDGYVFAKDTIIADTRIAPSPNNRNVVK